MLHQKFHLILCRKTRTTDKHSKSSNKNLKNHAIWLNLIHQRPIDWNS